MKIKKLVIYISIIILLTIYYTYDFRFFNLTKNKYEKEQNYEKNNLYTLSKVYDKLDSLINKSDIIIIGRIKNINPNYIYVKAETGTRESGYNIELEMDLEVIKCLKGSIKKGEILKLRKFIGIRIDNKDVFLHNFADVKGNYQEGMQKIFLLRKETGDNQGIYYFSSSKQSEILIKTDKKLNDFNISNYDLDVYYYNDDTKGLFENAKSLKEIINKIDEKNK
ncbi:hypothetical protein Q3V94_12990 [Caloramator sp. CAR-1]|uniref:hypothetical protein n=1 Tax=Caloramator sp. CAR-1 TaxID=3062777 RepID=UPI0026E28F73|nr:hypothetical protein [Caloramator sp. CAR-1]MDO6355971.1 hypothetical protein [Caloramator sp. CAR-1]